MIDKINNNQVKNALQGAFPKQPELSRASANDQNVDSLQVNYKSLIEKAGQLPQEDDKAVQRARELLLSGQLESPENIRAAAENIIKFGI